MKWRIQSLRARLTLWLLAILLLAWAAASLLAYGQTKRAVGELFDTQQSLLARQLLGTAMHALLREQPQLPPAKRLLSPALRKRIDSDALAFAIFDSEGQMRWNDGADGRKLRYAPASAGFVQQGDSGRRDHGWRVLFMADPEGQYIIAVGQEIEHRRKAVRAIVLAQMWPWACALILLVPLTGVLIGAQTRPLRQLARELNARQPGDDTPIASGRAVSEVRPLIGALNTLFERTRQLLAHTRRFTADAAHELRSPLTALRVQTEVAQLSDDDPAARRHALDQLITGIDRASRLVEQLLALSRLDPLVALPEPEPVDWRALARATIDEMRAPAGQRQVTLTLDDQGDEPALPAQGNPLLLALLLRNLLDNAVRYAGPGTHVRLLLDAQGIAVEDDGPGVAPDQLAQIGQRFFRPPGQTESGSGLGLSIVRRIAALHGLDLTLDNRPEGGFRAALRSIGSRRLAGA
jgi:two-component system sensor histidine kinase QseC